MKVIRYRGFLIEPKRDFGRYGFIIKGKVVKKGWLAVFPPGHKYEGCNAMPGATWAVTVPEAKRMIDAYIKARGRPDRFWRIVHAGA